MRIKNRKDEIKIGSDLIYRLAEITGSITGFLAVEVMISKALAIRNNLERVLDFRQKTPS